MIREKKLNGVQYSQHVRKSGERTVQGNYEKFIGQRKHLNFIHGII